jgi:6-phosphogluconolactonase (cycloisomerase 2 family)
MTKVSVSNALDGAKLVKASERASETLVQVWYGGTQVNVYVFRDNGTVEEVTLWSLSDEKGRPEEREAYAEHMEMHAGHWTDGDDL